MFMAASGGDAVAQAPVGGDGVFVGAHRPEFGAQGLDVGVLVRSKLSPLSARRFP